MAGLPNHLREKREGHGLTRESLGAIVRVSDRSLARYEAGERELPYAMVVLLALMYGCLVSELVPEWGDEVLVQVGADVKSQELLAICRGLADEDFEVLKKVAQGLKAKALAGAG